MAADDQGRRGARDRVPYHRYAFHNVYNYTLMGGVAATALLTQNWWLAVAGAGMEALWMVFGPDSRLLRRLWFDRRHEATLADEAAAERRRLMAELSRDDADRVGRLEDKRSEILGLCAENRAFTIELLRDELGKLDQLAASYLELVLSSHRYEQYLSTVDLRELEAGLRRHEAVAQGSSDGERRELAQKNLAVLLKRREKLSEIKQFCSKARGQMDLIENTFRLLADQIVTMRSPRELGGQLDELIDGVEAVRTTAREADAMLEAVSR